METIITDLHQTQSLTKILKVHNVSPQQFYETLKAYPFLAEAYTRAQSARADLFADEITDIADNEPDHNRARNMINARMWVTSKMKPHVYGDKIQLDVNQTVDIRSALDEAKNRIRNIIEIPKMQLTETTTTKADSSTGSQPADSPDSPPNIKLDDLLK